MGDRPPAGFAGAAPRTIILDWAHRDDSGGRCRVGSSRRRVAHITDTRGSHLLGDSKQEWLTAYQNGFDRELTLAHGHQLSPVLSVVDLERCRRSSHRQTSIAALGTVGLRRPPSTRTWPL